MNIYTHRESARARARERINEYKYRGDMVRAGNQSFLLSEILSSGDEHSCTEMSERSLPKTPWRRREEGSDICLTASLPASTALWTGKHTS
jgi:hypothetical protein